MTDREKLIELLEDVQRCGEDYTDYEIYGMRIPDTVSNEEVADHLIANGVTVQEWISVKDRLPTAEDALTDGSVYAYTKAKKVLVLHYQYVCRRSDYILCWMPIAMPQPPKEVEQ